MAEVNVTPKLRFPEFKTEWFEKKLSELLTFKNGVNAAKEDYGDGYKFINVLDIIQNDFITHETIIGSVKISETEFKKNIVEYGDILFQRSSETREEVGQANVYLDKETPATFGGFVIRGKKKVEYDPTFMNALLKTVRSRKEITSKSGGSTRYNVGQGTLSQVVIYTTKQEEQKKIASFLTAVDKRIQLLQKKKTKLEEYKKGVMQKLFSQEIRFKDENNNDFPGWVEKKLGEIGNTFNGLTGKTKIDFGEGKPYVQYMQIFSNSKINVGDFGLVKINDGENQNKVQYGDVFFTTSSETPNEIGTASVMLDGVDDVYLNSFCFGFRPNSLTQLVPEFSRYLFRSELFRRRIVKLAQGSTRFNISKVELMKLAVQLPIDDEQRKIASFLSTLDESIESVEVEINGTIAYKKGLLQKMFV